MQILGRHPNLLLYLDATLLLTLMHCLHALYMHKPLIILCHAQFNLLQEHTLRFQWTKMPIILSVMLVHSCLATLSPYGLTTLTTPCFWTVDFSQNVQKHNWNRNNFLASSHSVSII